MTTNVFSQAWGIYAGVNFSNTSRWLRPPALEISRIPGIQIGVSTEFSTRNPSIGFQTDVLFSQLGVRMESSSVSFFATIRETGTLRLNCILTRAHIQFRTNFNGGVELILHTGFHAGYALWATARYERSLNGVVVSSENDQFFGNAFGRAAELGVGIGTALLIQDRFRIGIGYDIGILFHNLTISAAYMIRR